jgi:hypothetical protein
MPSAICSRIAAKVGGRIPVYASPIGAALACRPPV